MDLSHLEKAADTGIEAHNPSYVIQAVNSLVPEGKDAALRHIEYCAQRREGHAGISGLFWVLRVLFDDPSNVFPPVRVGRPHPPAPPDPMKFPRFPIAMVRDIPFLVVSGYDTGGLSEPVSAHVRYFRERGVVRSAPLTPPSTRGGIVDEFQKEWNAAYGEAYAAEVLRTVEGQMGRLEGSN